MNPFTLRGYNTETMNDQDDGFEQALDDLGKSMARFMQKAVEKSEELLSNSGLEDLFRGFDFPDPSDESGTAHKRAPKRDTPGAQRQPAVDVFDEGDEVLIYVELPGVDESSLEIENRDGVIHLRARTDTGRFEKKIDVPHRLASVPNYFYKNGILKIQIKKDATDTPPAPSERS